MYEKSFLRSKLKSSLRLAGPSRLKTGGSKLKRGDQALYFYKLSQKQEILMKSCSLERRKSAFKLPLF